jgi:transposase InsO family protein
VSQQPQEKDKGRSYNPILGVVASQGPRGPPGGFGKRAAFYVCVRGPAEIWVDGSIVGVGSFNGKLRDELLNGEIFTTLEEAQVLTEGWRREYNQVRPHSSLGYKPPAPEAALGPLIAATS